ncbi:MAG: gliding motility lipoprotein GldD [Prevotellaceae bacterium]|jgi:gliding motility-associated lipoprotein GldD|nr:gliding motility lipoprotein GldD [Prevotellaceae bacterium]
MTHLCLAALLIAGALLISACRSATTPKPRGYYRIELPKEPRYKPLHQKGCPYAFDISTLASVTADHDQNAEPCWINVSYSQLNAKLHISYKPLKNNLDKFVEDVHYLVYKHTVKADAITEQRFESTDQKSYGYLYEIGGNAASNVQFYITDSARHFIRGALYFNTQPNRDSLAPVIAYITEDIRRMMESTRWQ